MTLSPQTKDQKPRRDGPVHIAALADEFLVDLGATIHDPGPGQPRTLTTPHGQTFPLPPRCECWSCGPHPDRRPSAA